MNTMQKVMLLIDADNVSADVMEQAVHKVLAEHGSVHVRRAYCNAETALKQQALFKRLSVRPMVNLSAGKNSTDIALAVDAMDLAVAERPDIAVLVSSDSDFAPLVIRLREKGCRVCGIGQQGKTGDETTAAYDDFTDHCQHKSRPRTGRRRPRRARCPRGAKPAQGQVRSAKRCSERPRARAAPAAKAASKTPPRRRGSRSSPGRSRRIHPPGRARSSRGGNKVELNVAAERLRAAKLLGKSASSPKLFKKLPCEQFAADTRDQSAQQGPVHRPARRASEAAMAAGSP